MSPKSCSKKKYLPLVPNNSPPTDVKPNRDDFFDSPKTQEKTQSSEFADPFVNTIKLNKNSRHINDEEYFSSGKKPNI
jgi:hypothetical protein